MLSKAAPRDHIHTRQINCRGYRRRDGLWDVDAVLEDTKTYSFDNHDRAGIASGEPIHHMAVRLTLDEDMVVRGAEAATAAGPFNICGDITGAFEALIGLKIGPGWRRAVLERMGGRHGCTHLTDLLLGPVATTALQTVSAARNRRQSAAGGKNPPPILNTCHALASDSPVVQRQWPDFYTGEPGSG